MQFSRELLGFHGRLERISHHAVVPFESAVAGYFGSPGLPRSHVEGPTGIGLKGGEAPVEIASFQAVLYLATGLLDKPCRQRSSDSLLPLVRRLAGVAFPDG